jgi:hypothetical protein
MAENIKLFGEGSSAKFVGAPPSVSLRATVPEHWPRRRVSRTLGESSADYHVAARRTDPRGAKAGHSAGNPQRQGVRSEPIT